MSLPSGHNENNLIHTYNNMIQSIKQRIDKTENKATRSLQSTLNMAKDQALASNETPSVDIEQIIAFIKHDIGESADYLIESSHLYSEWTMLDIDVAEQKFINLFFTVADSTRIELEKLSKANFEQSQQTTLPKRL